MQMADSIITAVVMIFEGVAIYFRLFFIILFISQICFGGVYTDGVDDQVTSADSTFGLETAFTFSLWIKSGASEDAFAGLVHKDPSSEAVFMLLTNGTLILIIENDTGWQNPSTDTVTDQTWTHVACTYDDTANEVWFFINGTPDTLGSAGDTLQITDLTARKFNVFLNHNLASSNINSNVRIDNISTSTYSKRQSANGGTDGTSTSQTEYNNDPNAGVTDRFTVIYGFNLATEEKLFISFTIDANTAGAGTVPNRVESVGKQSGTSTAYTRIDVLNTQIGSYDTDSNLSALGTN